MSFGVVKVFGVELFHSRFESVMEVKLEIFRGGPGTHVLVVPVQFDFDQWAFVSFCTGTAIFLVQVQSGILFEK